MTSRLATFIPLRDTQVSALAAVRAHPLGQALAGMARVLYELVAGAPAVSGEESASGTNPQGLVGVDLSGPPWGPAIRHPIATMSGLASTANVVQPGARLNPKNVAGVILSSSTGPWRVYNRQHEPIVGAFAPYSRARIVLRAHKVGATSGSVTVLFRNRSRGEPWSSTTISVTSTSETSFDLGALSTLGLKPGLNVVEFQFLVTTSGAEVVVDSVALYQAVKLSH